MKREKGEMLGERLKKEKMKKEEGEERVERERKDRWGGNENGEERGER